MILSMLPTTNQDLKMLWLMKDSREDFFFKRGSSAIHCFSRKKLLKKIPTIIYGKHSKLAEVIKNENK